MQNLPAAADPPAPKFKGSEVHHRAPAAEALQAWSVTLEAPRGAHALRVFGV